MNITRRGLMGMFAVGVAAAVLPSGVIMPVKNIQPHPNVETTPETPNGQRHPRR